MEIKQKIASFYKSHFFYSLILIVFCLTIFITVQQALRRRANFPQNVMIDEIAPQAGSGTLALEPILAQSIDILTSDTPFVIIYDENGNVLASSGAFRGRVPALPEGVFETIRSSGKKSFTWQPDSDIRIAAVMDYFNNKNSGFILIGRSLAKTDQAVGDFLKIVIAGISLGIIIQITIILWKKLVFKK